MGLRVCAHAPPLPCVQLYYRSGKEVYLRPPDTGKDESSGSMLQLLREIASTEGATSSIHSISEAWLAEGLASFFLVFFVFVPPPPHLKPHHDPRAFAARA